MNNIVKTPEWAYVNACFNDTSRADPIPIENTNAHMLLIHSANYDVFDYDHILDAAKRLGKMTGNGRIKVRIYPGGGHVLEPPITPLLRGGYSKLFKAVVMNGGEPRLRAMAQQKAWDETIEILGTHFKNDYSRVGRIPCD